MKKAIFFDRDGTIIIDKIYLNDPDQIEYLDGAFDALKKLQDDGYEFVIVTNQSGVARGIVDEENLFEIHRRMDNEFKKRDIRVLDYLYAPYLTSSDHYYRKPKPGMIFEGARAHNLDLAKSWMIGDRMTDVEAGHRAGTKCVLMGATENLEDSPFDAPEAIVNTIGDVADFILSQ